MDNKDNFDKVLESAGLSVHDLDGLKKYADGEGFSKEYTRQLINGAKKYSKKIAGRNFKLSDGGFKIFDDSGKDITQAGRSSGNSKGFNLGDLVGSGNDVSKFAGLVRHVQSKREEGDANVDDKTIIAKTEKIDVDFTEKEGDEKIKKEEEIKKEGGSKEYESTTEGGPTLDIISPEGNKHPIYPNVVPGSPNIHRGISKKKETVKTGEQQGRKYWRDVADIPGNIAGTALGAAGSAASFATGGMTDALVGRNFKDNVDNTSRNFNGLVDNLTNILPDNPLPSLDDISNWYNKTFSKKRVDSLKKRGSRLKNQASKYTDKLNTGEIDY
jgi:hypothetical protein